MWIYSPMPHTLSYCALIGECALIRSNTVFIFGMQVDNDVLYRGIANQPSPAYSSQYLSNFLSFHTLNDEIFRQRFL